MAAETILSVFLPVIQDKLISPAIQQLLLAFGKDSELQKLERILNKIQSVLVDAEERQSTDISIQAWLSSLKNLSYEAEDVLEEFEFVAQRKQRLLNQNNNMKVLYYCSNILSSMPQFRLCWRLNAIIKQIEKIADEINKFHFQFNKVPQISNVRPQTHSYVDNEKIIGREKDKEDIVRFLINHDINKKKNITVLPIVAMGGMGKTALCQLVYSDCRVEHHFQLRMWVCVSDADFDVARLVRLIIEAANKKVCELSNMELLQQELREKLSGKRCLIVLDDVWNDDRIQWEKLKTLLDCAGEGSVVVVSTRNTQEAMMMATTPSIHYLKQLSEEDSWELFRKRAFLEGAEESESLVKLGKDMRNRCDGLPLAINTLGSMMRGENDEEKWKAVLDSQIWKGAKDKILPSLRLSYNYLPPHLKQCFTFCAIYHKDYEMEKDTLIQLWMANGFIPSDGQEDLDIKGSEIFDELVCRSFFQNVKEFQSNSDPYLIYKYRCIVTCKMHDLMHDLAQSIMGKNCLNLENDIPEWKDIPQFAKHLLAASLPQSSRSENKSVFPTLRTIVTPNEINLVSTTIKPSSMLKSLRALKVRLIKPGSISHLKHLRWLDLSSSYILKVPKDICSLYNLQTLKLSNCTGIKELPDNLTELVNLRHLYIDGCHNLARMPRRMRRLKHLHTLTTYVVSAEADRGIEELCDLNLCGTLELRGIEVVSNAIDAQHANLSFKKNLLSLSLNGVDSVEVFEALKPHDGLKILEVSWYKGEQFPKWMNAPQHLKNLVQIKLCSCKKCKELPPLGQLPFLEILYLFDMDEVKHIINKTTWCEGNLHTTFFPSLKELHVSHIKNLESLPQGMESLFYLSICHCDGVISLPEDLTKLNTLNLESCNSIESLPQEMRSLTSLLIKECNKLVSLPEDLTKLNGLYLKSCNGLESLPREFESLLYLVIKDCDWLVSFPKDLTKLDKLQLVRCNNLKSLPQGMEKLRHLKLSKCSGITSLQLALHVQLPNLSSLKLIGHDEFMRPFQSGGDYWHLIEKINSKAIGTDQYYRRYSASEEEM